MPSYGKDRLDAMRVIESLRSGIPTRHSTRTLPDLRPDLMRHVSADLEALAAGAAPRGRLVWGQYGQGKSHFLTLVEHLALDMNFAVSFVTLSREVSCHNLFHFYRRAASAIRTPDSAVPGIRLKLSQKRDSDLAGTPIAEPDRYRHGLPAAVLELFLSAPPDEDAHNLYNDLMGERIPIAEIRRLASRFGRPGMMKGMPRFKAEHAPAYFGLMSDTVRLCGHKGWVILIDEVELVGRLGSVSRLNAYMNLNWLLNWSEDMPYPLYVIAACASSLQSDAWYGEGLRARKDSSAMPTMAGTRLGPDAQRRMRDFFEIAASEHCPTISRVPRERLWDLLRGLAAFHGTAHAWRPPGDGDRLTSVASSFPEDTPVRTCIRGVLEALDIYRAHGEDASIRPSELKEQNLSEDEGFFQKESAAGDGD